MSLDHLRDWHGTTRLLDRIAVAMVERGHSIVIIASSGSVSAKVPVSPLDYPHELIKLDLATASGRKDAHTKIALSGVDVCLASLGNDGIMNVPGLLAGSGIPFVFGDPHDPRVRTFAGWQPYESYGALACADAIQTLLPEYICFYPEALRERVTEIGIPAPPPATVDFDARRSKQTRTIVAVGRLNETMKRFSLLFQAFKLLHESFPDWRLKLVGDGPYWEYYHEMVRQLGIKERVDFTGAVLDPGEHYGSADVFCSSSLIEGFPLVLSEATAYALPIVGFDICTAYAAVITPEMGALARCGPEGATPVELAKALRLLMELTPEKREQMGRRGQALVQERYDGRLLFDKWETLLIGTAEKVRAAGETMIDRALRVREESGKMTETGSEQSTLRHIGAEWDGLGPESPVWSREVLDAAAAEITAREDPFAPPEESHATVEAENARLRCEIIRLKEDYNRLEKKYDSLSAQILKAPGKRRK